MNCYNTYRLHNQEIIAYLQWVMISQTLLWIVDLLRLVWLWFLYKDHVKLTALEQKQMI